MLKKEEYEDKANKKENDKEIIKTWLTGQHSCTLIVPRSFAKRYGLDEPSHVIVEGTKEGILIRKLEV
ncbi:MAG: hypothetical protein R2685_14285 [Candidatus Nitrosocosmicus sp.]|nr:hypothetical protein [Candidatus Nitrosocosmicus sp.]